MNNSFSSRRTAELAEGRGTGAALDPKRSADAANVAEQCKTAASALLTVRCEPP